MNHPSYTGVTNDDRRIAAELQAMGAFDGSDSDQRSALEQLVDAISAFVTWMRWKGEVSVYGCRVGAGYARVLEAHSLH